MNKTMFSSLVFLGLMLLVSCSEAQKSPESDSQEKEAVTQKDSGKDSMVKDGEATEIDVISMMRKKLEGKDYALTEAQMAQVDSLLSNVDINMDLPKEEFKKNLKELRESIYNDVLNEQQKKVYEEKGLEVPK